MTVKAFRLNGCLLALAVTLLVAGLEYSRGLPGGYLLDDYDYLPALSALPNTPTLADYVSFLTRTATGDSRPLSVITFALQQDAWPYQPESFLTFNIFLHLFNALLVFLLLRYIFRTRMEDTSADWLAVAATAFWLLNPIHVSGVLYIFQRVNLMSATFVLAGLLLFLKGRELEQTRPLAGRALLFTGLAGGGGLALLCKENGALIWIFAVLLELLLRGTHPAPSRFRMVLLYGPLLLGVLLIAAMGRDLVLDYASRNFTLGQRLLTETRILCDYLFKVAVPGAANNYGLFHDHYPISTGVLSPPTTLLAIAFLIGTSAAAWLGRHRIPLFLFGWSWFLGGHLMESTVIPIELYFEHRNYVPSIGIVIILASLLGFVLQRMRDPIARLRTVQGTVLSVLALSLVTLMPMTTLWSSPLQRSQAWLEQAPDSRRAITERAVNYWRYGSYEESVHFLREMIDQRGGDVPLQMLLYRLYLTDAREFTTDAEILALQEHLLKAVKTAESDWLISGNLILLTRAVGRGEISRELLPVLDRFHQIILSHPGYSARRHMFAIRWLKSARFRTPTEAMTRLADELINHPVRVRHASSLAEYLASQGRVEDALEVLEDARSRAWRDRPSRTLFHLYRLDRQIDALQARQELEPAT